MKKKKNVMYRKSVSLLAAAAMTAVLMTGQVYPVLAEIGNIEANLETSSLIPDNVTIDSRQPFLRWHCQRATTELFPGRMEPSYRIRECRPAK